jgi:hypothetical protein
MRYRQMRIFESNYWYLPWSSLALATYFFMASSLEVPFSFCHALNLATERESEPPAAAVDLK